MPRLCVDAQEGRRLGRPQIRRLEAYWRSMRRKAKFQHSRDLHGVERRRAPSCGAETCQIGQRSRLS